MRHRRLQQVTAGSVQNALGLAGRTGGIQDEQRILRIHVFRLAIGRGFGHGLVVPDVTTVGPVDRIAAAPDDDDRADVGTLAHGLVGVGLERHLLAAAHRLIGRDHDPAIGVDDTVAQRVGRKTAEDDRMNRADTGTGEHRHRGFGNHRHVDRYPITLLYAAIFEHIGEFADFLVQFAIGQLAILAGIVPFPDDRNLVAAAFQVTVEAVEGNVELGPLEPLDVQIALVEAPVAHRVPGLEPGDVVFRLLGPEAFGVLDRLAIHFPVLIGGDVGLFRERGRHRIYFIF